MYYKLTYISSKIKEQIGDCILCGNKSLHIGQSTSCNLLLPDSDDFEPQLFATILPSKNNDGWYIVKRTDFFDVYVNGKPLVVSEILKNNDKLTFSDKKNTTCLNFKIVEDGEYDSASGILYRHHKTAKRIQLFSISLAIVAIAVTVFSLFLNNRRDILKYAKLDKYNQSIYHIATDSVYLICDTIIDGQKQEKIIKSIKLEHVGTGTCFLTEDSLFVTARHCIEPWINDEVWNGTENSANIPPEVNLAIQAETLNRLTGEKKYSVRAHCIISRELEKYSFYSTDFKMNKSRDQVLSLGSKNNPLYLRTIIPIANRRDMELGDFAYVKSDSISGNITMASIEDLKEFDRQNDKDIVVIGFPVNDNDVEEVVSKVFGNSQHIEFDENHRALLGCIQMTAPINKGNSGGPVFARVGREIKVIGIVSKADILAAQGTFWVVPISEVNYLIERGGKMEEDTLIFRR